MSFWVWSKSNDIISASSNPTNRFTPRTLTPPKQCHQTPLFLPPQPLRQMTLSWQTTTSSSSSSSSIEERVWSRRIVLSHAGQVRFSDKIHCSHRFSASREKHDLLVVGLLVSSDAWWRRRLSELWRWTYGGEWEILSMDGEERERIWD